MPELESCILFFAKSWMPAREIVERAIRNRLQVDPSGEIIVLERGCPWKEHLLELEKYLGLIELFKYCLYQDTNGTWRIQCVPNSLNSFGNRLDLPWKGLRDQELSVACGIDDCIFVHISGFIGGNKTFKGALEMARKALNSVQKV